MKLFSFLLLGALATQAVCTTTISTIKIVGNKFFDSDSGDQFFLKGIAYQQSRKEGDTSRRNVGYIDSLSNPTTCMRDSKHLGDLGVNVIRVYQIDPDANHDECMAIMQEAGIYVLTDLAEPNQSINRDLPSWDVDLLERYTAVADAMGKYNNTLGYIVGNEVTNSKVNTDASPFVKAAIRDVRAHIKKRGYRQIPLGYATNDDSEIRQSITDYFVCEEKGKNQADSKADFVALNMYEWCGYSSYATSGYRERTSEFCEFPAPIFFGEFGCNIVAPRPFTEIEALYGTAMTRVWSGGLVYEYFNNINRYGIVEENNDGSVAPLADYEIVKQRFNTVHPQGIKASNQKKLTSIKCPKQNEIWNASTELPPTPDSGKCECLQATLSCIVTPYKDVSEIELLNQICATIDCSDIQANGSNGKYGEYSDCGIKQRLSWALNKFYLKSGKKESSCNFGDAAVIIANGGELDIGTVFASDGRTCEQALGKTGIQKEAKIGSYFNLSKTSSRTKSNDFTKYKSTSSILKLELKSFTILTVVIVFGLL